MPIKKIENRELIYIHYTRDEIKDLESFKREITNVLSISANQKDVVVDFSGANIISSAEISVLVRFLNVIRGTPRQLRIIAPEPIHRILVSTNLNRLSNVVFYDNQKTFFSQFQMGT